MFARTIHYLKSKGASLSGPVTLIKDKTICDWQTYVEQQLDATASVPRLNRMRDVVKKRYTAMMAFGHSQAPQEDINALSPTSRKTRDHALLKQKTLDAAALKGFEKRLMSYQTLLSTAVERLIECHKEECWNPSLNQ